MKEKEGERSPSLACSLYGPGCRERIPTSRGGEKKTPCGGKGRRGVPVLQSIRRKIDGGRGGEDRSLSHFLSDFWNGKRRGLAKGRKKKMILISTLFLIQTK